MAEQLMDLACCSRDEALELLNKTGGDVMEALALHMGPPGRDAPKPKKLSMIQQFFKDTREEITKLTDSISKGFIPISADQSERSAPGEMQILPEETALQNSCCQECRLPVHESEVQIPETVCRLPSECSSDLPSNAQTSLSSDQECRQSCPCPGKVSLEKDAETVASGP